jgi:hypothetical protein
VAKKLCRRPNLDHLRRQAKSLLSSLESGDPEALATILNHLPSAQGMTAGQVRQMQLRLADAQSAIARKTGFASWPQLARHVEQLRVARGVGAHSANGGRSGRDDVAMHKHEPVPLEEFSCACPF